MKPRSDSLLFKLTREQQAQIFTWIESIGYAQTLKNIAAPPPDGFGLKTHLASLHHFYRHYLALRKDDELFEAIQLLRSNSGDPGFLRKTAENAIAHAALQLAISPDPQSFGKVAPGSPLRRSNS
jgi:hypothetical protein